MRLICKCSVFTFEDIETTAALFFFPSFPPSLLPEYEATFSRLFGTFFEEVTRFRRVSQFFFSLFSNPELT